VRQQVEGVGPITTLRLPSLAGARVRARPADEEFAAAYSDLFRSAMRLAYRLTRDAALAEDVAAEALARAYARWSTVRDADCRTAWVQRVAANIVIDGSRRNKVAQEAMPVLVEDDVVRIEDQVTLRLALLAALAALPRRQREAVVLRYLAGVEEPELSRAMGASPSSVRTHVQRGLATLRGLLAEHPEVLRA
jgi:RNA polymerase sigma factor (sigma-70 family)